MVDAVMGAKASAPGGPENPVVMRVVQDAINRPGRKKSRQTTRDRVNAKGVADHVPPYRHEPVGHEPREPDQKLG